MNDTQQVEHPLFALTPYFWLISALATLGLQALRTSHQARGPASGQSSRVPPPYLGPATHLYDVTVSPQGLFAPVQEHAIAPSPQGAQGAHDAYPYLPPLASSHFDPLNLPYMHHGQGQPIIDNAQYTDVDLDWLSSVAEASYTPTNPNPTILVSPASGNYATFTSAPNTCVTGSHSDIGPVCVPGAPASPFNSLGPGLTPSVSATPSTFDFSASPGLTQHSPVVPYAVHPLTEEPEGEQGFNLVALFSRPPSVPYGNLAIELPHSKEIPSAPPCDLLMVPLPTQPVFTDHTSSSARRVPGTAPPRSSGRAPYATGRKEVRFPNQKKVNVVEDMCRRFPEASDGGKLLKRICAAEWYHKGDLEPTFGNGSEELTYGLALGFEAGHSVLLGFTGNEGECLYCGHTSPKRDRIIAHMREHLGLRPFVCMDEKCPCRELPV